MAPTSCSPLLIQVSLLLDSLPSLEKGFQISLPSPSLARNVVCVSHLHAGRIDGRDRELAIPLILYRPAADAVEDNALHSTFTHKTVTISRVQAPAEITVEGPKPAHHVGPGKQD